MSVWLAACSNTSSGRDVDATQRRIHDSSALLTALEASRPVEASSDDPAAALTQASDLDLATLLRAAEELNPAIAAAREEFGAAGGRSLQAGLLPNPTLRLEAEDIPENDFALERVASIRQVEGPSTITREWQSRRIVVQCNVQGRDVGGFVEEAQRRIASEVDLPQGYHLAFGGQFEHLERAQQRLMLVVPLAIGLILFLLHLSTGSWRDTLLIFTGAPFAALGGVVALWWRDMPFTIAAGVGFVAVSGVAMLNGLVLASTLRQLLGEGAPLNDAIERSALLRLRPVLMTALVAGLGFVPMALNTGVGAEVQRPLATVVVGGVVSDALLTLLVLPALFAAFGQRRGG